MEWRELSNEEYQANRTHESWSRLERFEQHPRLYHEDIPRTETSDLVFGSYLHCLVLEPASVDRQYWISTGERPDMRTKAGKAEWQRCQEEAAGRVVIWSDEHALATEMHAAIGRNSAAVPYVERCPLTERSLFWKDSEVGLNLRARFDALSRSFRLSLDLKTIRASGVAEFRKASGRWNYHRQSAIYLRGQELVTGGEECRRVYLVVSKEPPIDCMVYEPSPESLAAGRLWLRDVAMRLNGRRALDYWEQDGHGGVVPVDLPMWHPDHDQAA